MKRYANFFELFQSFRRYVEFFLLQDLVNADSSEVRFFLPFDGFETSPLPGNSEAYLTYMSRSIAFVTSRNARISAHWTAHRHRFD